MHDLIFVYNRINDEVKKKGKSVAEMLRECNLDKNTVGHIKRGNEPSARNLAIIAQYLDVTSEYLLGLSDYPVRNNQVPQDSRTENLSEKSKIELEKYIELLEMRDNMEASEGLEPHFT